MSQKRLSGLTILSIEKKKVRGTFFFFFFEKSVNNILLRKAIQISLYYR